MFEELCVQLVLCFMVFIIDQIYTGLHMLVSISIQQKEWRLQFTGLFSNFLTKLSFHGSRSLS